MAVIRWFFNLLAVLVMLGIAIGLVIGVIALVPGLGEAITDGDNCRTVGSGEVSNRVCTDGNGNSTWTNN